MLGCEFLQCTATASQESALWADTNAVGVCLCNRVCSSVPCGPRSLWDAVFKKDGVPLDYVATGELHSPQCENGEKPLVMNAWEVDISHDGVVACELPDFEDTMGAKIAALVPCGMVNSSSCMQRIDGLPNAVVLRSPESCAKIRPLPQGFSIHCFPNEPKRPAPPPHPYGRWGYRVGVVAVPQCHVVDDSIGTQLVAHPTAWLFRDEADSPQERPDTACAGWDSNLILQEVLRIRSARSSPRHPTSPDGLTGWALWHWTFR